MRVSITILAQNYTSVRCWLKIRLWYAAIPMVMRLVVTRFVTLRCLNAPRALHLYTLVYSVLPLMHVTNELKPIEDRSALG